jgi:CBS domain containing-hemolysin-like protein
MDKDNIIGMIHLRDVLENIRAEGEDRSLGELARDAIFVPESQNISTVMALMRTRHIHLAIVVDEYGGTAGLITLEDILEELVGEISDEYDQERNDMRELSPGVYEINGSMSIGHVEKLLGANVGEQDDDTIGGLVFSLLGRKPELGDKVSCAGYNFEVSAVKHLRIEKLKVYPEESAKDE